MSISISALGCGTSAPSGLLGIGPGSLVQGLKPLKNKQIYDSNKGKIQVESVDNYALNLFKFFTQEYYKYDKTKDFANN
jgi:hypothetical protein